MLWPSFILGLFGSLHCVGMCGPIALALPAEKSVGFIAGRILYNSGRIFTYSLLGGLVAVLGVGAALFHWQQYFSIAMGVLMLLWGISETGWTNKFSLIKGMKSGAMFFRPITAAMRKNSPDSLFVAGAANGLLPCGMVYLGLGNAAISGSVLSGMGAMALFGLGTFPVMTFLSLAGKWITPSARTFFNRAMPFIIILFALLMILRGAGLGIPYLSPEWNVQGGACCHKH